jgi:hypothetical protein
VAESIDFAAYRNAQRIVWRRLAATPEMDVLARDEPGGLLANVPTPIRLAEHVRDTLRYLFGISYESDAALIEVSLDPLPRHDKAR